MILPAIVILLTLCYSLLIFYYWQAWKNVSGFHNTPAIPQTQISIIIPARNEEKNIKALLVSILDQSYPKELFEIIVVDDDSSDSTAAIVSQYSQVRLIQLTERNSNAYKKKAIETGIHAAKGALIVTTDADCTVGKEWLSQIAQFKQEKDSVFIAAPVRLSYNSSILELFQALDFLVLQGITAASVNKGIHSMCNGANLAYEKQSFYDVDGFSGIDKIASGDDLLLMHKIKEKYPDRVHYLKSKETIVTSQPMKTWKEFLNQRIRWASKAFYYKDKRVFGALVLVYLFNLSFLALLVAGFFNYWYWVGLIGLWLVKTIVELSFVSAVAKFYGYSALMKYFFFFQPLHITYTIIAGLFGQFGKYEWKGRRVK
jgi:cellulose synthase/poly-beta-1,6-N-acetylglucosamine synthase-like glycosyltransferase